MIDIVGVYPINQEVHLVEVVVQTSPYEFDVSNFTQEDSRLTKENWQVAYDEHYLNEIGDTVIGDFFKKPDVSPCRIAFFIYYLDFNTPLTTPFNEVNLPKPSPIPSRLKSIIHFEEAD